MKHEPGWARDWKVEAVVRRRRGGGGGGGGQEGTAGRVSSVLECGEVSTRGQLDLGVVSGSLKFESLCDVGLGHSAGQRGLLGGGLVPGVEQQLFRKVLHVSVSNGLAEGKRRKKTGLIHRWFPKPPPQAGTSSQRPPGNPNAHRGPFYLGHLLRGHHPFHVRPELALCAGLVSVRRRLGAGRLPQLLDHRPARGPAPLLHRSVLRRQRRHRRRECLCPRQPSPPAAVTTNTRQSATQWAREHCEAGWSLHVHIYCEQKSPQIEYRPRLRGRRAWRPRQLGSACGRRGTATRTAAGSAAGARAGPRNGPPQKRAGAAPQTATEGEHESRRERVARGPESHTPPIKRPRRPAAKGAGRVGGGGSPGPVRWFLLRPYARSPLPAEAVAEAVGEAPRRRWRWLPPRQPPAATTPPPPPRSCSGPPPRPRAASL